MLFGSSFAKSRESLAFTELSLMFSRRLCASDAMLVKRRIFHVHQSLLVRRDRGPRPHQVTHGFKADLGCNIRLNIKTGFDICYLRETTCNRHRISFKYGTHQ